jgi:hypothetical protein
MNHSASEPETKRAIRALASHDVVLTTYGCLEAEVRAFFKLA